MTPKAAKSASDTLHRWAAWLAPGLLALVLSPLLVGYEPVGGDPDRIFRPIKSELARALKSGTLPFWSDKLGLGIPLLAESHAAALYPPNHILYRAFDVNTAYRLSMWLHNLLIAAATFAYARTIGINPWGAALAGVTFALCGFQAIHSSHEWAYHTLAFLPLLLLATEKYLATGRLLWLAILALLSGLAWTLGHFQIQTWTHAIVAVVVLWRVAFDRRPFIRSAGVIIALMWGALIAAAQLGPSWELARFVGQENRDRIFYSYPPSHWVELAFPQLFRGIHPEDPYWFKHQTTGYEACFYIGTIPLLFAFVGLFARNRATQVWKFLALLTIALATMPQWWRQGYEWFTQIPALGMFRCPARWTAFASFALALLAGAGFDPTIRKRWFWIGLALGSIFGLGALLNQFMEADTPVDPGSILTSLGIAPIAWAVSLAAITCWRRTCREPSSTTYWGSPRVTSPPVGEGEGEEPDAPPRVRCSSKTPKLATSRPTVLAWAVITLTACELGFLYYNMTTQWGWAIDLRRDSPVIRHLSMERDVGLVAGEVDNLPVLAGLATAEPYVGFRLVGNNAALSRLAAIKWKFPRGQRYQWDWERLGISHVVTPASDPAWLATNAATGNLEPAVRQWKIVWHGKDDALSRLARSNSASNAWVLLRNERPVAPMVGVKTQRAWLPNENEARNFAFFHFHDQPQYVAFPPPIPEVRHEQPWTTARLLEWDGKRGKLIHNGSCGLVLRRACYPGWMYRVNEDQWHTALSGDGGFQTLWIDVAGRKAVESREEITSQIEIRYSPTGWPIVAAASATATLLALTTIAWVLARTRQPRQPQTSSA